MSKPFVNLADLAFDHQHGFTTLRYLAVSNQSNVEVCEYQDVNKVGVFSTAPGGAGLRKMFHAESVVDHYDREPQASLPSA